ncbi:MAG: hypothetical protein HY744_34615 [Deltaproteobacteria bacterium]|nr:hypothetical protein [Deltaproteobacteria bacterium]
MKVFLGGEGPDELGSWVYERPYRDAKSMRPGVVEALLRKVSAAGWAVVDGLPWRLIRKYRHGREMHAAEMRNVLGLALRAAEAGCQILAFVRDRDGDDARERDVEAGIGDAKARFPQLKIVGGVAIEELEAWLLALLGSSGTEAMHDAKALLADLHEVRSTEQKVELVEQADLPRVPKDAVSLKAWLGRAEDVLQAAARR